MIYCISDIHGCYKEFMTLLKQIDFQPEDTLYIIGDAIDRGEDSIKCLQFIMNTPNIKMLMGNHELFMRDTLLYSSEDRRTETDEIWRDYNGGEITYKQFTALPGSEQKEILNFVSALPFYTLVAVRNKKYLLIHAGLDCRHRLPREKLSTTLKRQLQKDPSEMVWIRKEFINNKALPSYTIVFGHTPTRRLHGYGKDEIWYDKLHKDKICIDCGCYGGGRLAALRLDDGEAFYVPKSRDPNSFQL